MKMEDLIKDPDFLFSTNLELALYKLLEDCGIPKKDILAGVWDKEIGNCKALISKHINKTAVNKSSS